MTTLSTHDTVHALFDAQATATPHALAVADSGDRISYELLDARATALAHRLQAAGVGPDLIVPVLMDRSAWWPVAFLAVLRAGGAFLPLSHDEPVERLKTILIDTGAPVVLTQRDKADRFTGHDAALLFVDEPGAEEPDVADDPRPQRPVRPDNLAYVVYTSGSTGRPKAVCLPHGALVNLFAWYRESIRPGARVLQFAPLAFDVSLHELFAAVASGGELHLFDTSAGVDPQELARFVHDFGITRVVLPPVILQYLAEADPDPELLASLTEIVGTGDRLDVSPAVAELVNRIPGCELRNHYGATESQGGTQLSLAAPVPVLPGGAPLGDAVLGVSVHVTDSRGRAAGFGQVGEICFAGAGHARGYLGSPGLTAERFVPDAVSGTPGGRLYRTGDLGRVLPNGDLEFRGRIDRQVKVRGVRVEPHEVEVTLTSNPLVRQAAVVAQPDPAGGSRLVAYVVPGGEHPELKAALRDYLADRLPDHLVPQSFVELDELPVSANGKIDRSALPQPTAERPATGAEYQAPSTATEQTLAAIWSEVLGVAEVGVHDDFFELGGDSIKALLMVSRATEVPGVDITIRRIFDTPTIASLLTGTGHE